MPKNTNKSEVRNLLEAREVYQALADGDPVELRKFIERLFASIPVDWHRRNRLGEYEGYYASVFYSHLPALGCEAGG